MMNLHASEHKQEAVLPTIWGNEQRIRALCPLQSGPLFDLGKIYCSGNVRTSLERLFGSGWQAELRYWLARYHLLNLPNSTPDELVFETQKQAIAGRFILVEVSICSRRFRFATSQAHSRTVVLTEGDPSPLTEANLVDPDLAGLCHFETHPDLPDDHPGWRTVAAARS